MSVNEIVWLYIGLIKGTARVDIDDAFITEILELVEQKLVEINGMDAFFRDDTLRLHSDSSS